MKNPAAGLAVVEYYSVEKRTDCRGSGYPVLMLHGLAGPRLLDPLADRLKEHFRVVIPTLPGWLPPDGRVEYNDEVFVDFVEAVRRRLGYPVVAGVGFSTGGRVLLNYALKYPQFLDRIVLIDSAGLNDFSPLHSGPLARLAPRLLRLAMSATPYLNHLAVEHLVDQSGPLARWLQTFFSEMMSHSSVRDNYVAMHAGMGSRVADWRTRLPELKQPALILWSSKDTLCPVECAQEFSALLRGSRVSVLKGYHHYGVVEQPDFFLREMVPFLQEALGTLHKGNP